MGTDGIRHAFRIIVLQSCGDSHHIVLLGKFRVVARPHLAAFPAAAPHRSDGCRHEGSLDVSISVRLPVIPIFCPMVSMTDPNCPNLEPLSSL